MTKLKIGILSYRSAPFGGGQGIYVRDISKALTSLGHSVDVISGEPYPELYSKVGLIKLPGMNLFETFSFKDRLKKFIARKARNIVLADKYFKINPLELEKTITKKTKEKG